MADWIDLSQLLNTSRPADHVVARRNGQPWYWSDWAAAVAGWAQRLAAEPAVALYFEDSSALAAALFGAWQAGKTVWLPGDNLPETQRRLAAEATLVGDWAPAVQPVADSVPSPRPLDPQQPALVVYTSGSSGEPTAIPKRLQQLQAEVQVLERCFGATLGNAAILATVTHQHLYGLLFRVLWPLAAGRALLAQRLNFPEDLAHALGQYRPAALVASPAHLKRLPDHLAWATDDLTAVFSSGGPLTDDAWTHCGQLLRQTPIEIYGSSETGGVAWRQRSATDAAWQPLPGVEWRLQDEALAVRSAFLPNADWWLTADRARAADTGFVLLGRLDRIAKIEEKRVSLTALEQHLQHSGWLTQARVIELPGQRTVLGVVAEPNAAGWSLWESEGKRGLVTALRGHLAASVEPSVLPKRWRLVNHWPLNSLGKITQAALQALFDPRRPPARLLAHDAHHACWELETPATLPYFDGHFPQAPILPGVAQLEWAMRFAGELWPLPPAFRGMETIKFQQVIAPGARLQLDLHYQPERGSLQFKLASAAGQHASGRLLLGAPA